MVIEEEEDEESNVGDSFDLPPSLDTIDPSMIASAAVLQKAGSSEGASYLRAGNDLIRQGKVAVVLFAVESASNLGSD